MNPLACELRHVDERIAQRGTGSRACIVSPAPDAFDGPHSIVVVDLDSPHYPRDPKHGGIIKRPPASQRMTPAAIWREWHERAGRPVVDHQAEQRYITGLARRTGCGVCKDHWRAYLATHTIDTSTPEAYTRATFDAHNHVSSSIGKPVMEWADACALYGWPE